MDKIDRPNPVVELISAGQDAQNVRPGDFILCHRRGFASWVIRVGTRSRWSHAAFVGDYTPDGKILIEALTRGVVRTPLSAYRGIEYAIVRTGLQGDDQAQAVAFAQSCVNDGYGWGTDIIIPAGIVMRYLTPGRGLWFGMDGTEICSGLVAQTQVRGWANYKYNPASMSPEDLWQAYPHPDD